MPLFLLLPHWLGYFGLYLVGPLAALPFATMAGRVHGERAAQAANREHDEARANRKSGELVGGFFASACVVNAAIFLVRPHQICDPPAVSAFNKESLANLVVCLPCALAWA